MRYSVTTILMLLAISMTMRAASTAHFKEGKFDVYVDPSGKVTVTSADGTVLKSNTPEWGMGDSRASMADCSGIKVKTSPADATFGKGRRITVAGRHGTESVTATYDIYPEYIITLLRVDNPREGALDYMAPVACTESYTAFPAAGNYSLSVPFDNDAWVRYSSTPFGADAPASHEVSALLNADSRRAIIVGSVDHDTWKSGIDVATSGIADVDTLRVYAGISDNLTRDVRPHGAVRGKSVSSPRMLVAPVSDWRDGMELYGDLCTLIAPKIESRGPRPFGWNSWGKLQAKITYDKAVEVSDFIRDNLQECGFHDADSTVYIDLDAFWDFGFRPEQHAEFVRHCRENGQKPGIYYCPFTDWGKNPEAEVGEMPQYKFKDIYLYHDGKPLEFDGAYAIDPTHPATQARIAAAINQFKDWGYEYVKIDFMAHGSYEADSHFDPEVTTGIQAYNRGMQFIDSVADGKMWINLSIAPLLPGHYAHSRRIGCDAWADINNSEYTLNALTYGWWLDHIYHYNDADHIVYEGVSDGENRARITSSALTGVYFLGDDLSAGGDPDTKRRAVRNSTNEGINRMARECKSFRPVEIGSGDRAADMFTYTTPECVYVAIFNFSDSSRRRTLPLRRLGLSEGRDYHTTELWSGDKAWRKGAIDAEIPAKDVKVWKIDL